jgi:hypothetical protein
MSENEPEPVKVVYVHSDEHLVISDGGEGTEPVPESNWS